MSEFDALTGLLNRNCFENSLPEYQTRGFQSLGCVCIDANGLHRLNNTHSHEAGPPSHAGASRPCCARNSAGTTPTASAAMSLWPLSNAGPTKKASAESGRGKGREGKTVPLRRRGFGLEPRSFSAYGLIKRQRSAICMLPSSGITPARRTGAKPEPESRRVRRDRRFSSGASSGRWPERDATARPWRPPSRRATRPSATPRSAPPAPAGRKRRAN